MDWFADEGDAWRVGQQETDLDCLPMTFGEDAPVGVYLAKDSSVDQGVYEEIHTYPTPEDAADAMVDMRAELGQCASDRDDVRLDFTWEYDELGDAALQSYLLLPEAQDINAGHFAYIGAVRSGSRLAVVAYDHYTQEPIASTPRLMEAVAHALCGDGCVGDIVQRQTYPSYRLAADPFPQGENFGRADITYERSPDAEYNGEAFCVPDTDIDGAVEMDRATWRSNGAESFHEMVIEFGGHQAAVDFMTRFSELPQECVVVDGEPTRRVTMQPTRYDGLHINSLHTYPSADNVVVWAVESEGEPAFAGAGMGRLANFVVLLGFTGPEDPTVGSSRDWVQYAGGLVDDALNTAVESG